MAAVDVNTVQQATKAKLERWISSGKKLVYLVTGKTGAGKSSLINGIVGQEIAVEGDITFNEGGAVTTEVTPYEGNVCGVPVQIIDSPGLQDLNSEELSNDVISNRIKQRLTDISGGHIDIMIYCVSMLHQRIEISDSEAMLHLTQQFTAEIWKKTVFVLTHANEFRYRGDAESLVSTFQAMIDSFKAGIQKALVRAGCPQEVVNNITVVPAGYYTACPQDINPENPWKLPGYDDWFSTLWAECANKLDDDPLLAMVGMSSERFVPVGTEVVGQHRSSAEKKIVIDDRNPLFATLRHKLMDIAAAAIAGAQFGVKLGAAIGNNRPVWKAVGGIVGAMGGAAISFFTFWLSRDRDMIDSHPHFD